MATQQLAHPTFGGLWTQQKLDILRGYLDAYTTVLKPQPFTLMYVDAFAGSGWYRSVGSAPDDTYGAFDDLRKGSAAIALEVDDKPFDHLCFIEKNPAFCLSLEQMKRDNAHRWITVAQGDANKELQEFCGAMGGLQRAVVFLDPYATEVDWATIEAIAKTQKIDCWILFPLSALSRMMDKDHWPNETLSRHLDRVFGGRENWRELYRPRAQLSMLPETDSGVEREPYEQIAEAYRERLRSVFTRVAPTSRQLRGPNNTPLFELMFAASNPAGAETAVTIADHLLRNW